MCCWIGLALSMSVLGPNPESETKHPTGEMVRPEIVEQSFLSFIFAKPNCLQSREDLVQ